MKTGLIKAWIRYERFLRIDPDMPRWDLVRTRTTYAVGWIVCALQALNLIGMTLTYGGWTFYHWTSVGACAILMITTHSLRYNKSTVFHTCVHTALIVAAVGGTAFPGHYGIDTSLLPYLAVCPVFLCFLGGWRVGPLFFVASTAMIVALANDSGYDTPGFLTGLTLLQQQRAIQAVLMTTLACAVGTTLSAVAQNAFENLELATRRAKAAEAAKSDFLATMSHELRTPMNGVLGLTDVLLADEEEPLSARQREMLQLVGGTGNHLLRIVDDILDLSKMEAGKLALDERPFDLRDTLKGLAATFAATAPDQVALTSHIAPDVATWLHGDDHRLRQIVSNLVSNALKFTEAGSVEIEATLSPNQPGHIDITVTDTGCGIPLSRQEAVFAAFEQAEQGTTRRFGGTGLGLAISRKLAVRMGGDIALDRSDATGSVFRVRLPLPAVAHAEKDPAVVATDRKKRLYGLRVLVVDDNAVNRLVAGEVLKAHGALPVLVNDGEEGIDALRTAPFDAVLMDKHMPIMDGIAATRAIRASGRAWSGVPIVAVTADAMAGEERALLACGMDAFTTKPVKPDAMAAAIECAIEARRTRTDDAERLAATPT